MLQETEKEEQRLVEYVLQCDMKNAYELAEKLALQGNGKAMFVLGEFYIGNFYGAVKDVDRVKARYWREKGAEKGDQLARLKLGYMCKDKNEQKTIFEKIFSDILVLAEDGDVFAMDEVARLYWSGLGCERDTVKRDYWFQKAAEKKYWRSIWTIIDIAMENNNNEPLKKYASWAIELNCAPILTFVADGYHYGIIGEENKDKAYSLYKQAADGGSYLAMRRIADFYNLYKKEYVVNCPKDNEKNHVKETAMNWYRQSARYCPSYECFLTAFELQRVRFHTYPMREPCFSFTMNVVENLHARGAEAGDTRCIIEYASNTIEKSDDMLGYETLERIVNKSEDKELQITALNELVIHYYSTKRKEETAKQYAKQAMELGSDIGRKQYEFFLQPFWKKKTMLHWISDKLFKGYNSDNLPRESAYNLLNPYRKSNIGENRNE